MLISKNNLSHSRYLMFVFHFVCWLIVVLPAVIFVPQHEQRDMVSFLLHVSVPMLMCIIFYVNYLWLVPKYVIPRKFNAYIIGNVVLIIVFALLIQWIMDFQHSRELLLRPVRTCRRELLPIPVMLLIFFFRNVFSLLLSAGVATLIRIALRWQQAETERKEMEIQKTEAELRNLRNQINPHFLLNTLNNIYALIAFDQERAQKAVLSLSALLRQMLYGNQDNEVLLKDEQTFLANYIDLMKIRTASNVTIEVNMQSPAASVKVAPFIFISLVENAFKHGISPTQPSYISVDISSDADKIICVIKNTNFPKSANDKSGHGIGLQQVEHRLRLSYADHYEWIKGVDTSNNMYISKIIIYDTKLCNNR